MEQMGGWKASGLCPHMESVLGCRGGDQDSHMLSGLTMLKTGILLAVRTGTDWFPTLPGCQALLSVCMEGAGEGAVDKNFEVAEVPVRYHLEKVYARNWVNVGQNDIN